MPIMKLEELTDILDSYFHKECSLDWDNCGLLIGDLESEIKNILVCLDVNKDVIKESLDMNAVLIFSHHPFIFMPVSNIVSKDYTGKTILNLIENKIALYCAHTNYDMMKNGLNDYIAGLLELTNKKSIIAYPTTWFKFVTFAPLDYEETIRNAMCLAGGGQWKDYSCCTFKTEGKGSFKPDADANPFIGKKDNLNFVEEVKLECIVSSEKLTELIDKVIKAHPYEEPAYDVYRLENKFEKGGMGRTGDLKEPLFLNGFLNYIKTKLNLTNFRYIFNSTSFNIKKKIKKVAAVNGSVNSSVENIKDMDFDVLVCGEINYHNAQMLSELGKLIIELGHAESELFAISHIYEILKDINNKMHLGLKILKSNYKELSWRYFIGK